MLLIRIFATFDSWFAGPNKPKPARTPNRRVAAVKLVWDLDLTKTFMDACVAKKEELRKEIIPISVWKEMSDTLKCAGYDKSWDLIRAKYENMKNYFSRALENGGMQGGIRWPYYSSFCEIYELDAESDTTLPPESEIGMFRIVPGTHVCILHCY